MKSLLRFHDPLMKNDSNIFDLCREFLKKLMDRDTRQNVPIEVGKLVETPITGKLKGEDYTRYLLSKTLMEMYKAGVESCKKMKQSHMPTYPPTADHRIYYRSKQKQSIAADEFALQISPVIKEIRASGDKTLQQVADRLTELGIMTQQGGKWYAKTVRKIESRIARIQSEFDAVNNIWP